MIDEIRTIY